MLLPLRSYPVQISRGCSNILQLNTNIQHLGKQKNEIYIVFYCCGQRSLKQTFVLQK